MHSFSDFMCRSGLDDDVRASGYVWAMTARASSSFSEAYFSVLAASRSKRGRFVSIVPRGPPCLSMLGYAGVAADPLLVGMLKGYKRNERRLRPGMVVVCKAPAQPAADAPLN